MAEPKEKREVNKSTGYIVTTGIILILLIISQIYWVIGNQLTAQLDGLLLSEKYLSTQMNENQQEFDAIANRFEQNEKDSPSFTGRYTYISSPEWKREILENRAVNASLQAERDSLKSQLERTSEILLVWSSSWNRLFPEVKILHSDKYAPLFEEIDGKIDAIEKQLSVDPDGTKAVEGQKSSLDAQLAYLRAQLNKADESQKVVLSNQIIDVNAKINLVKDKSDLESQLTQLGVDKQDIQKRIDDLAVQRSTFEAELADLDANKQIIQKQNDEAVLQEVAFNRELDDLNTQSDRLDVNKQAIQGQKDTLETQLTDPNTDKTVIQEQIDALEKQLTDLDANKVVIQGQINNLNAQKKTDEQLAAIKSDFEKQLADLNAKTSAILGQINNLATQKTTLDEEVATKEEEEKSIQGQIVNLQIQIADLPTVVDQPEFARQIVDRLEEDKQKLIDRRKTLELQEQAEAKPEETRQAALQAQLAGRFVLVILQSYWLPLLYGLLGAGTSVLRKLSNQIDEDNYSEKARTQHQLRIALGAMAGIMVGWLTPNGTTTFLGAVSPLAIAFIVGYNIDVFFALMDAITSRIEKALTNSSNSSSDPQKNDSNKSNSKTNPDDGT